MNTVKIIYERGEPFPYVLTFNTKSNEQEVYQYEIKEFTALGLKMCLLLETLNVYNDVYSHIVGFQLFD